MADYSSSGEGNCLICWENVDLRGRKVVNLPNELGGRPGDAFLKICELLKVSFSEIQKDWRFNDGGGGVGASINATEKFPFCLLCLKGFQSVIKLQQQLIEIQKKIDEKLTAMRGKIRETSNKSGGGTKEEKFRLKALAYGQRFGSECISSTGYVSGTSVSTTSTLDPSWTLWSSQEASPPVTKQQPVPTSSFVYFPTETKTLATPVAVTNSDNYQDSNDDYFGPEDDLHHVSESSSESDHKFPPKPPTQQKTFSILPSANRRLQTSRQLITIAKKTERQAEYFSPIEKTPQGQMFYEGILITPIKNKGYQCGQCDALVGKSHDTISLRKTKIHIKGFHLGAYRCALCSKNFSSNDILSQHISRLHEGSKVPCPVCGKPIRDRLLKHHLFTHMNATEKEAFGYQPRRRNKHATLPCRICDKKFQSRNLLQRHELSHLDPIFRRDFKCPQCDKGFTTNQALTQHIEYVHEHLNARKKLCKICGESIYYRSFKDHMKMHKGEEGKHTCRYCNKRLSEKQLPLHEKKCKDYRNKGEGLEFGCDVCNKYFKDWSALRGHRRKVHKMKTPKCLQDVSIDKEEDFLEDLNNEGIQHVDGSIYDYQLYRLEKMEGGGGYECLTCKEEFEGGDEEELEEKVKNHVRSRHMGNYRCNKCTKRMKTLFEAQVHQRLEHSKAQSFDCDICGRRAIPVSAFKKHLWLHKNVWEVAECINTGYSLPLSYTTCDTQEVLKEMGVEVNLKCGICERSGFDKVEDLYSHRRKDHQDTPLVPFPMVKNPKLGRPSMYPEGPIDCPICGKYCEDRKTFVKHRYKHERKKKGKRKKEEVESEEEQGSEREAEMDRLDEALKEEEDEETVGSSGYEVEGSHEQTPNQNDAPDCRHCGKILSRRQLPLHEEKCGFIRSQRTKENGYIFECEVCNARFKIRRDLQCHRRKVHHLGGIIKGTTVNVKGSPSKRKVPVSSGIEDSKLFGEGSRNEDTSVVRKRLKVVIIAEKDKVEGDEVGAIKIEVDPPEELENADDSSSDTDASSGEDLKHVRNRTTTGNSHVSGNEGRSLQNRSSLRGRSFRNLNYAESDEEDFD